MIYKIGEIIEIGEDKVVCKEIKDKPRYCPEICYFSGRNYAPKSCYGIVCSRHMRLDRKEVYFEKVEL
jgi:hypothetical protein